LRIAAGGVAQAPAGARWASTVVALMEYRNWRGVVESSEDSLPRQLPCEHLLGAARLALPLISERIH
jgi:hypothetical protein